MYLKHEYVQINQIKHLQLFNYTNYKDYFGIFEQTLFSSHSWVSNSTHNEEILVQSGMLMKQISDF